MAATRRGADGVADEPLQSGAEHRPWQSETVMSSRSTAKLGRVDDPRASRPQIGNEVMVQLGKPSPALVADAGRFGLRRRAHNIRGDEVMLVLGCAEANSFKLVHALHMKSPSATTSGTMTIATFARWLTTDALIVGR